MATLFVLAIKLSTKSSAIMLWVIKNAYGGKSTYVGVTFGMKLSLPNRPLDLL